MLTFEFMTGLDLAKLFGDKIDEGYSDYVNPTRKQRMFDTALIRSIEDIYMDMDSQKERDELSAITVLDKNITINSNTFRTRAFAITGVAYNGTVATFTLAPNHNLQAGDSFTVSDVAGLVGANGVYTLTASTASTITGADPGISGTYTAGTGKVVTSKMLEDYLHLLAMRCRMYVGRKGTKIDTVVTGTVTRMTTFRPNSLRTGDEVRLDNVVGVVGLPPTGYIMAMNMFTFDLYSDVNLTVPIPTSGSYQLNAADPGRVKKIYISDAIYQTPDEQISDTTLPSVKYPKVRQSEGYFNIYPTSHICESVSVDYIKVPEVKILVDNSDIDLYNYYSPRFLERVVDEAVKEFMRFVKDLPSENAAKAQIIDNP